jgi:hypothetical protein
MGEIGIASQVIALVAYVTRAWARTSSLLFFIPVAPPLIYGLWRPAGLVRRLPDWYGEPLFPGLKRTTVVRLLCSCGLALLTFFLVSAFTCHKSLC